MKKIVLGAALSALSLAIPSVANAQKAPGAVIVVVDTERVYRECTACVAAQSQLQGLITSSRTRAQQLGEPLQTEGQSLEQAAAALAKQTGTARTSGENALKTRVEAFQQRRTAAQQEMAQLEQNIQSTQANVVRQINERLNPIISQVMSQKNANLALDTNTTLARSANLDVTNDVLAALNSALPSVSVTPLPAPPAGQAQQPAPQTR